MLIVAAQTRPQVLRLVADPNVTGIEVVVRGLWETFTAKWRSRHKIWHYAKRNIRANQTLVLRMSAVGVYMSAANRKRVDLYSADYWSSVFRRLRQLIIKTNNFCETRGCLNAEMHDRTLRDWGALDNFGKLADALNRVGQWCQFGIPVRRELKPGQLPKRVYEQQGIIARLTGERTVYPAYSLKNAHAAADIVQFVPNHCDPRELGRWIAEHPKADVYVTGSKMSDKYLATMLEAMGDG